MSGRWRGRSSPARDAAGSVVRVGWRCDDLHEHPTQFPQGERFVQVLEPGQLPSLAHVTHTNKCVIGLTLAGKTDWQIATITSAIDNLGKGAAGQAVQNMNVMFGLEETHGVIGNW